MFANDFNIVGNEVNRVEPNSKLTDQIHVTSTLNFLNESCNNEADQASAKRADTTEHLIVSKSYREKISTWSPWLSYGTQVLHEIFFCHSNTSVADS